MENNELETMINALKEKQNLEELIKDLRLIEIGAMVSVSFFQPIWDEIEMTYKEQEFECIEAYKNSDFYERDFYKSYTAQVENILVKIFSIYAWKESLGEEKDWLKACLRKSYKRYIEYIERTSHFNWTQIPNFIRKREGEISDAKVDPLIWVTFYYFGDRINYNDPFTQVYQQRALLTPFYFLPKQNLIMDQGKKQDKQLQATALKKLNEVLGFKIAKEMRLEEIIGNHQAFLASTLKASNKSKPENFHNLIDTMGLNRYYKSFATVMRTNNYDDMHFAINTEITRDELLTFYAIFYASKEYGRLNEDEFEVFFAGALLIHMLSMQYRKLSEYYSDSTKKKQELLLKQAEINQKKEQVQKEKKEVLTEISRVQEEITEKDKRIDELERLLKQKELQEEENRYLKQEVVALRDYAFRNQHENDDTDLIELDTTVIKKSKVAMIGGHQRLHQRLKEKYPHIRTVHPNELNIDLSFIKIMDIVCIETSYNNHSLYRKAMKEIERSSAKLFFINGQYNIEKIESQLVSLLK